MKSLLLKSVSLLNGKGEQIADATDISVIDGVVTAIGKNLEPAQNQSIHQLEGCQVFPGLIDGYAHAGSPGHEDIETFSELGLAARKGGFTTVCIAPDVQPVADGQEVVKLIRGASQEAQTTLLPLGAISQKLEGKKMAELIDLANAGVIGFTDGDAPIQNTDLLLKTLQYAQHTGLPVFNRPEDYWLAQFGQMHEGIESTLLGMKGIPGIAEYLMVKRDLDLVKFAGGQLHFNCISTKEAVGLIRSAKAEGLKVTASVAVANLLFTDQDQGFDTAYKFTPVLRSAEDQDALLDGLWDGTIDLIVTNHKALDIEQKRLEFDMATPGAIMLQTALSALHTKYPAVPVGKWVNKLVAGPTSIFNLPQRDLEVGQKANFVVWCPKTTWAFNKTNAANKVYNSPLINKTLNGRVILTFHPDFGGLE